MDVIEQIKNDIKSNKVMIYMKGDKNMPQCGFSAAVVDVFQKLNVPFETRNVLTDPALRDAIKQFSNWPTLPQVYIDGEFIGGCDITLDMYKSGELAGMLQK
jgi:monothiol glutaredoxin